MRLRLSAFWHSVSVLGPIVACSGAAVSVWIERDENARGSNLSSHHPPLSKSRETPRIPRHRVASADWADRIRTEEFWRELRSPQSSPSVSQQQRTVRSRSEKQRTSRASAKSRRAEDGRQTKPQDHSAYRTVCVRLCDGYFWPIRSSADSTTIAHDRKQCEQSCATPARLYLTKDIDAPLEDMRDEAGRYYRDLKTAFVYRSVYLADCKCKAHPWEDEARARHEQYAKQAGRTGRINTETVQRR